MSPTAERLLAQVPIFAGLGPRDLAALARRSSFVPCPRGSTPVQAGAAVPGVLVLAKGALRLSLRDEAGEERVLRLVAPGEAFCLASAVLDQPSPYQATALSASELLVVPAAAIRSLLEHGEPFARTLVQALAARELELCAEIHAAAFRSGAQRLASYLESLAPGADESLSRNGARTVRLPCSKTLIAARLGMKKETLSRLLKRFAGAGFIAVSRGEIAILDPVGLEAATRDAGRARGSVAGASRRTADRPAPPPPS